MPDTRPVLVAMNNPYSNDRAHALYPHPPHCAGWNLWRIYHDARCDAEGPCLSESTTRRDYAAGFERVNVLSARTWSQREANAAGRVLMDELSGRRLLVLGVGTLRALALPRPSDWLVEERHHWLADAGTRYALAPHPSGRCREYNDAELRLRVGRHMVAMLRELA